MADLTPEVFLIRCAEIDVDLQQIRETPDDDSIGELAESIIKNGLLQPIGVSRKENGRYQLRWGHRRLLAHRRAALAEIKAVEYEGSEASIKGLALVENLHRAQMTMREEVDVCEFLRDQENKSTEQIASILSKSRSWVLNRLMIPSLPDFLKDPLLDGALPISHVEIIARVPDEGAQQYLTTQAIFQRWNRSQLKTIADCYMVPPEEQKMPAPGTPGFDPGKMNTVFLYPCEVCHERGTLEQMTLVRVHADGYGCRTTGDRSDHQSNSVNEVERHANGTDSKHDPHRD